MTAIIAIFLGLLFGFALQRVGLGNYDKVVNQFRFKDNTMVAFMMTAVAVGAVGVAILQGLGVLDTSTVPQGFLAASLVGGLILGVGMAIAGTCPGTIFAGIGQGNIDYLVPGVLGMIFGALVYGLTFEQVTVPLWDIVETGTATTAELLNVNPWVLVVALVACAAAIYAIARKLGPKMFGATLMALASVFLLVGCASSSTSGSASSTGTIVAQSSQSSDSSANAVFPNDQDTVTANELSDAIIAQQKSTGDKYLEVVDVRKTVDYADAHIPNSMNIPLKQLQQGLRLTQIMSDGTVVLVGTDESEAEQAKQTLVDNGFSESNLKVLEGGYESWVDAGLEIDKGAKIGC